MSICQHVIIAALYSLIHNSRCVFKLDFASKLLELSTSIQPLRSLCTSGQEASHKVIHLHKQIIEYIGHGEPSEYQVRIFASCFSLPM